MRRLSQLLAVVVAGGILAGVVLAGLFAVRYARNDRPIVLPKPRGAHPVGRMVLDWTDAARSRELIVFVWYPATASAGGRRAQYVPGKWGEEAAQAHFLIPAARIQAIEVASREEAPAAPGAYPVLVLLPSLGRAPAHYTTLAEDLASHGFVVVGFAPTGSIHGLVFPNGRREDSSLDPDQANAEVDASVMRTWLGDARFTVDHLLAAPQFARVLQADRVGLVGHAFGGAVAMELLATDGRFRAGVDIDGLPWREPLRQLARPLLILVGGRTRSLLQVFSTEEPEALLKICRASRASCTLQQYERAGSADFTDVAVFPSRFPVPARLVDRGSVDGESFQREVADKLLEFFGRTLVDR